MKVKEQIINNGKGPLSASYLVIHETANPGATALNHVDYWKNDPTFCVHYVMDWSQVAYHCVPDNRLCWHVGNGNDRCVGIELCHATNRSEFDKVWYAAAEFAAWYLKKRGWGIDRLLSHDDCRRRWGGTDHTDPLGYFREFGKTWEEFKVAVKDRMAKKPEQHPGKAVNDIGLKYRAHVQTAGWLAPVHDGQVAGTTGYGKRMEALKITPPAGVELAVDAHIQGVGWRTYSGIKKGASSGTGSSSNDPIIGTVGQGKRLEAIRIRVIKKPESMRGKTIHAQAHVQGAGWVGAVGEGQVCGTTGQSRRLEAVKIWFA